MLVLIDSEIKRKQCSNYRVMNAHFVDMGEFKEGF